MVRFRLACDPAHGASSTYALHLNTGRTHESPPSNGPLTTRPIFLVVFPSRRRGPVTAIRVSDQRQRSAAAISGRNQRPAISIPRPVQLLALTGPCRARLCGCDELPAPLRVDETRARCLALFSSRKGAWHRSHRISRDADPALHATRQAAGVPSARSQRRWAAAGGPEGRCSGTSERTASHLPATLRPLSIAMALRLCIFAPLR